MRTISGSVLIVLLVVGSPSRASAEDIPPSCLMSFNVKNKSFVTGNATMSCVLMEQRRGEMFTSVNKLNASGTLDGPSVAQQIAAANAKLLKAENDVNWTGWSLSLSGNLLATAGLASCVAPTPGCVIAVVGKIISTAAIVDAATDEAAKRKASMQLRAELGALQKMAANAKPAMGPTRSQLVEDSIQLCEAVRQQCL